MHDRGQVVRRRRDPAALTMIVWGCVYSTCVCVNVRVAGVWGSITVRQVTWGNSFHCTASMSDCFHTAVCNPSGIFFWRICTDANQTLPFCSSSSLPISWPIIFCRLMTAASASKPASWAAKREKIMLDLKSESPRIIQCRTTIQSYVKFSSGARWTKK